MKNKIIHLGKALVGPGHPCYVIGEIGSNHNRDIDTACKLIKLAKDAGCNAVKLQSYTADGLYSIYAPRISQMDGISKPNETPHELIKRVQMPVGWHRPLKKYADEIGIALCSTPFDESMVDILEDIDIPFYKIASFEITHYPLLKLVAQTGKPVILSTGNSDMADVREAVRVLKKNGCREIALLHCVSNYPAREEDMNLRCIPLLAKEFHLVSGLSDHTEDPLSSIVAVALGASIIEKHITLDKSYPGPDHPFALNPEDLHKLIQMIRRTENVLGVPLKRMQPSETENHRIGRRSIVAKVDIRRGARLTEEMLILKRPGLGLHPKYLARVVGCRATRDIRRDEWVKKDDLQGGFF